MICSLLALEIILTPSPCLAVMTLLYIWGRIPNQEIEAAAYLYYLAEDQKPDQGGKPSAKGVLNVLVADHAKGRSLTRQRDNT